MLKLTEEGRALFERTGALLIELDEAAAAIASGGERPRGRLRISAPLLFSQTAMGKLAAAFAPPKGVDEATVKAVEGEEGWMLGL